MNDLRGRLAIPEEHFRQINRFLTDPQSEVINDFLAVVEKHGGPEEINRQADAARQLPRLLERLKASGSAYYDDVQWLMAQRDAGAFVSIGAFRRDVLGESASTTSFDEAHAVTLEISALQFFPWLIAEAKQAIERGEIMPGRYIRVRNMKEQVADRGDTLAVAAAMQIIGASYVETLDTKGTDGSNVHLGGPETITGYFGGVGQPNRHALDWVDEFLGYYKEYGIRQVLNVNPGTVLLGYLLHKLGIDIEFKISVYMGNDNPYAALWTMLGAKLFAREDGTTSLIGFNWANSVDNETIEKGASIRDAFEFEDVIRFEHHITETQKSIVIQPYDRTDELVALADHVANISAKHEGGKPAIDSAREHPSDILEYFLPKEAIEADGLMEALQRNFLDKHDALNVTATELTKKGLAFIAAGNLHAT